MGRGWLVERDRLLDLIDRIRAVVPGEIGDARAILRDRNDLLAQANDEAELVLTKARHEAELRVAAHDLTLDAQRRAAEIIEQAREQTRTVMEESRMEATAIRGDATSQAVEQAREADRYSLDVLRRLEAQLTALTTSVRAGVTQLDQKMEQEEAQLAVDRRDRPMRERRSES